jgi:protein SCO1/2
LSAATTTKPAGPGAQRSLLPIWLLGLALVLTIALFFYARKKQHEATELPAIAQVPAFDARDQRGRAFGAAQMKGAVWVVDFVFTSCPTVCPRITRRMADLQARLAKTNTRVPARLLSISVDPDNDTPEKLAAFGAKYGARDEVWTFATGKTEDLDRIVVQGFKQRFDKADPDAGVMEILHGDRFVLVDAKGTIRAYYDTSEPDALDRIVADVERVAGE